MKKIDLDNQNDEEIPKLTAPFPIWRAAYRF